MVMFRRLCDHAGQKILESRSLTLVTSVFYASTPFRQSLIAGHVPKRRLELGARGKLHTTIPTHLQATRRHTAWAPHLPTISSMTRNPAIPAEEWGVREAPA